MALTDEDMQFLQKNVKSHCDEEDTTLIRDKENGKYYKVINKRNDTTQSIAVAPCDKNGKNIDYSQTAIVVAGTQPPILDDANPLRRSYQEISTFNALSAAWGGYLTNQTEQIDDFYKQTEKEVEKHSGGEITNISGHSQAGPATAKVAAKHNVDKVTNFDDWGAQSAVDSGDITKSDLKYLKEHAHVYSDEGNDVTKYDGHGGKIPYGTVYETEGSDHSAQYSQIKGNGLNVDYYVKKNQFCSGMTKEQVEKVAKAKAKADAKKAKETTWDPSTWFDSTNWKDYYEKYISEYKKKYGSYADSSKKKKVKGTSANVGAADAKAMAFDFKKQRGLISGASGSKRIRLRRELVEAVALKASSQSQKKSETIRRKISQFKEDIETEITDFRAQIKALAQHLSESEVEELLAELTLDKVWDSSVEASTLSELNRYSEKLQSFSSNLSLAAQNIEATDQEGAQLFN